MYKEINMLKIIKNKKAFTLLEIIIVTFIISMGLVGVMSLFLQTIKVQNINKSELIASQLAQEGIETIRNIRDENWILGNPYDDNLSDGNYAIDYLRNRESVTGIDHAGANLKIFNNKYLHSGIVGSPFNRVVSITDVGLGDYLDIVCTVQWDERGDKKQYTAQTYLYDWQ
jgi:prepilin-type N-terminal cleavage/methylation domain-containing protein